MVDLCQRRGRTCRQVATNNCAASAERSLRENQIAATIDMESDGDATRLKELRRGTAAGVIPPQRAERVCRAGLPLMWDFGDVDAPVLCCNDTF